MADGASKQRRVCEGIWGNEFTRNQANRGAAQVFRAVTCLIHGSEAVQLGRPGFPDGNDKRADQADSLVRHRATDHTLPVYVFEGGELAVRTVGTLTHEGCESGAD